MLKILKTYNPQFYDKIPEAMEYLHLKRAEKHKAYAQFSYRKPKIKAAVAKQLLEEGHASLDLPEILKNYEPELINTDKEEVIADMIKHVSQHMTPNSNTETKWITRRIAEYQFVTEQLEKQECRNFLLPSTAIWTRLSGTHESLVLTFSNKFKVNLGLLFFPTTFLSNPTQTTNFFKRRNLPNGIDLNPPFDKKTWTKVLLHTDEICYKQQSSAFLHGKQAALLWTDRIPLHCPISWIVLTKPMLYLRGEKQEILSSAPFKTVIACVNLSFPTQNVENDVLGYFRLNLENVQTEHLNSVWTKASPTTINSLLDMIPRLQQFETHISSHEKANSNTFSHTLDLALAENATMVLTALTPDKPLEMRTLNASLQTPPPLQGDRTGVHTLQYNGN